MKRNTLRRWPRALFAYEADPRFSYCVAVPPEAFVSREDHQLVVAIHGSSRGAMAYRDSLRHFAERERCVVLAPLFPIGPLGDANADGYKYLAEGDIRYDRIVLGMVAELEGLLARRFERFLLCGYSGGAQFAHRFFYLYPDRLAGVSVGAPGAITRIDNDHDYWLGTRDWEQVFGRKIDVDLLRQVPVQLVVGALDAKDIGFGNLSPSPEQIIRFGRTRLDRINLLHENYQSFGLDVSRVVVPGVGHEGLKTMHVVESFFARILEQQRRPALSEALAS